MMEPNSIALDAGMRVVKNLQEILDNEELDGDLPFMAIVSYIIERTIASFNDLKEYYEILLSKYRSLIFT